MMRGPCGTPRLLATGSWNGWNECAREVEDRLSLTTLNSRERIKYYRSRSRMVVQDRRGWRRPQSGLGPPRLILWLRLLLRLLRL